MKKTTVAAIQRHAMDRYPQECCGVVIRRADTLAEIYLPAENELGPEEALKAFEIGGAFMASAEDQGTLMAIIHSHPDGPDEASEADQAACNVSGLIWYIQPLHRGDDGALRCTNLIGIAPASQDAPLVGRQFAHGVLDCYELIRDWFRRTRGVELAQHERENEWWRKTPEKDLYISNLAGDGWRVLGDGESLKAGDMIVMQVASVVPNHAAVYLGDEPVPDYQEPYMRRDRILHHLYGRPSAIDVYGGMWKHCTRVIARHQSQE
jgi:proteasome lid subunit RPN8/RPN11